MLHTHRIIFIHGLFGDPYKTWTSKPSKRRSRSPRTGGTSSTERRSTNTRSDDGSRSTKITAITDDTFWPRDLLPGLIADVRIFTWGYDADIDGFGSRSQNTINQHAGSLLSDIADQREAAEYYKGPIIFVAHSLGGIIVKAALNRSWAEQGTERKDIAPAISGICFLGTPHGGSKSASLGKVAYGATVAATRRPNTKLLQGLKRNSVVLEQIGDTFTQTLLRYSGALHIYSFREEKETRKYLIFNTIVSQLFAQTHFLPFHSIS